MKENHLQETQTPTQDIQERITYHEMRYCLQLRKFTHHYSSEESVEPLDHIFRIQSNLHLGDQLDDPARHDLTDISANHSQCQLCPPVLWSLDH